MPRSSRLAPRASARRSTSACAAACWLTNTCAGPADRGTIAPWPDARDSQAIRGPRALQQGLGDEEAKAQPGRARRPCLPRRGGTARGDVGLAQGVDDVEGNTLAVVGDGDEHLARRPAGDDLDRVAGEVDGVLDQVAEPVDDAGPALAHRLVRRRPSTPSSGWARDDQASSVEAAIGLGGLVDQLRDAHARVQRIGLARAARQLAQDLPAAHGLRLQQRDVVGESARPAAASRASSLVTSVMVASGVPSSCAAAAARPSSACSCCSRASTSLGGGQRIRHLPRLLGQPPDVQREKHHARQHGGQDADACRAAAGRGRLPRIPGQRHDGAAPAARWRRRPGCRARWCCAAARVAADTVTGATSRNVNGFSMPPVR